MSGTSQARLAQDLADCCDRHGNGNKQEVPAEATILRKHTLYRLALIDHSSTCLKNPTGNVQQTALKF